MTTANEQIATGALGFGALVEMFFTSGTVRVSTLPQNITWNGFEWTGLGVLGAIDQIETSDEPKARPIGLTLNVADPSILALANGGIDTYRGQNVNIYLAVLDPSCTQVRASPKLVWFGVMDVVQNKINEDGTGLITMKCEPHAVNINRKNTRRVSDKQQQREFAGDLGYQYLEDMIGKPTVWLSKKFQQV